MAERCFATLKCELVDHSSLGYLSPIAYELQQTSLPELPTEAETWCPQKSGKFIHG